MNWVSGGCEGKWQIKADLDFWPEQLMTWTAFVLVFLVGLFISGGMRERRSTARCKGPSQALSLDTNARVENHRHRCSTSSEQLDSPWSKQAVFREEARPQLASPVAGPGTTALYFTQKLFPESVRSRSQVWDVIAPLAPLPRFFWEKSLRGRLSCLVRLQGFYFKAVM